MWLFLLRHRWQIVKYLTIFQALVIVGSSLSITLYYLNASVGNTHHCGEIEDFYAFYSAAWLFWQSPQAIYDIEQIKAVQQAIFSQHCATPMSIVLPFVNPPVALLPFLLLAKLDYRTAALLWLAINFLLSGFLVRTLLELLPLRTRRMRWFIATLALGNPYWVKSLLQGQLSILLTLCLLQLLLAYRRRAAIRGVFALVLLTGKPQQVLYLVAAFCARAFERRWAFKAAAGCACALAAIYFFLPYSLFAAYGRLVLALQDPASHVAYGINSASMTNFHALLQTLFHDEAARRLSLYAYILLAVLLGWLWWRYYRTTDPRRFAALLGLTLALNLFFSPWLHRHDLLLSLAPLLLMLYAMPRQKQHLDWAMFAALYVAAMCMWTHLYLLLLIGGLFREFWKQIKLPNPIMSGVYTG